MEVSGRIKEIMQQQTFGSGFTKREMVLTTEEKYPQHLLIEFVQEKVSLLSEFNINELVTVSINLRGREWQAPDGTVKYFNSIQGWKITNGDASQNTPPPPSAPPMPTSENIPADNGFDNDDIDDLPF